MRRLTDFEVIFGVDKSISGSKAEIGKRLDEIVDAGKWAWRFPIF